MKYMTLTKIIEEEKERFERDWQEYHWGYNIVGSNREEYTEKRKEELKYFLSASLARIAEKMARVVEEIKEIDPRWEEKDDEISDFLTGIGQKNITPEYTLQRRTGFNYCLSLIKSRLSEFMGE